MNYSAATSAGAAGASATVSSLADLTSSVSALARPSNTASAMPRAIRLYARGIADAVLDGRANALTELVKSAKEETVAEAPAEVAAE